MATDRVEFSFSIKEMTFSFKGDRETGQGMQRSIERSIGSLVDAQSRVIGVEDAPSAPPAALQAPPVHPARRRRRSNATPAAVNGASPAQEGDQQEPRQRRSRSSGSPRGELLSQLLKDGFFAQDRTVSEVRHELSTRGHIFEAKDVSMGLLLLTRDNVLGRQKNAENKYAYRAKA